MPRGDGTGPMGLGPMTGRAAGYCAGYPVPGFMNPYGGRFGRAGFFPGAYGPTVSPYAAGYGWPGPMGAVPYRPFGLGMAWRRGGGGGRGRGRRFW